MFNAMLSATPAVDLSVVQSALSNSLNVANIGTVIAAGLGASMGLYLLWWGSRKLFGMVTRAFSKGTIKI